MITKKTITLITLILCAILFSGCIKKQNDSSLEITSSKFMQVSGEGTAHNPFTATSTNKDNLSTGEVVFNVTAGGTLNFQITARSEATYDLGRIYVNGTQIAEVSGVETSGPQQVVVSEGDVVRFTYEKDEFVSAGNDEAILDFLFVQ